MRVSIDSAGGKGSGSSSGSSSKASKPSKGKGEPLDQKQKIKAGIAIGVIVLAVGFILWQSGLFEGSPARPTATEPTPEQLQELAKQQPEAPKSGARLAPPRPLGSQ